MSERIEMRKAQEIERPVAKDEDFNAYLEGNLRFPQNVHGISIMLGRQLLKDGKPDFASFAASTVSPDQFERMKQAMNNAHHTHNVHVHTEDFSRRSPHAQIITLEKVRGVWELSKIQAMFLVAYLGGLSDKQLPHLSRVVGRADPERFTIPLSEVHADVALIDRVYNSTAVLRTVQRVLGICADTLSSEEGKAIAKNMKNRFRSGDEGDIASDAVKEMSALMVQRLEEAGIEEEYIQRFRSFK